MAHDHRRKHQFGVVLIFLGDKANTVCAESGSGMRPIQVYESREERHVIPRSAWARNVATSHFKLSKTHQPAFGWYPA